MLGQEEGQRAEELQQKINAQRRRAFEDEIQRLDVEIEDRAQALALQRKSQQMSAYQQMLSAAHEERQQAEEALHSREEELHNILLEERNKKHEARRREEEESHLRIEENQKRKEELARRRTEEEQRRQVEQARRKSEDEDRRRREEETRHKGESDRRRREDELRRQEEMRRVKEEEDRKKRDEEQRKKSEEAKRITLEQQRKEEERQQRDEQRRKEESDIRQRIETQITKARSFFSAGDYEHALVEVAKALVNDPMNVDALDIEEKIKEAQNGNGGFPAEVPEETTEQRDVLPKPKQKQKAKKKKPAYILGQQQKAPHKKRNPRLVVGILISIVITLSVVTYFQFRTPVTQLQQSFAILPWTSASNVLEESIIGSALAEEVTERFERLRSPIVTGYSTSYGVVHHTDDPEHSVFQLGSLYTLKGKVTRAGDTVLVALELVDSLGKMAWSDGFMKTMGQLSQLPEDISLRLADAFGIASSDRTESFTSKRALRNGEAYQFYLRGLELRHRRTQKSQRNALALFEQAIELDPTFAEANAEASNILITEFEQGWAPYDTAIGRARQLAESAIIADPSVSLGYVSLGRILSLQKNYKEALANINSALQLSPNSSDAFLERGIILLKTGKSKEAVEALSQAYRLNARDPRILEVSGLTQQFLRTTRQGIWYHQSALYFVEDSSQYVVGPIADAIGSDPELLLRYSRQVISACEHNITFDQNDYFSMYRLARVKQLLGKSGEAKIMLTQAEERLKGIIRVDPKNSRALTYLALTLTRLGRFPDALGYARRAIDIDPRSAEVKYRVAQMYSLQMYSGKKKEIDPKKKEEALKILKQALTIHYQLTELTNADFFNMYDLPEYGQIIQEISE